MNDREMLELAAKAMGLEGHRYSEVWKCMAKYTMADGFHGPEWNSLITDGEAFRLAAHLELNTFHAGGRAFACDTESIYEQSVEHGGDKAEAMRRAVTMVAARIAEAME